MKKDDMPVKITQNDGFVEIEFSKNLSREAIEEQVGKCVDETCTCCSPEFRENVDGFEYSDKNGAKVKIFGDISKVDVEENVKGCAPKLDRKEN